MKNKELRIRNACLWTLGLLLLAISVQYAVKVSQGGSAFIRWKNQLQALEDGTDIYQTYAYPNAPMMALLLYPLSELPEVNVAGYRIDLGAMTWFYVKAVLAVLAVTWTFNLVESEEKPFPFWAKATVVLLSLRPIVGDLMHGNVNLLILFLVVGGLYLFRRGWDGTAGMTLALAMTKVTPALFLPYLLWKRAWRAVAGCLVGLVLFFGIMPAVFLGSAYSWKLHESWMKMMIVPYVVSGEVETKHNNQSLPGMVYRLLTASPSFDEDEQPEGYYNLLDLEPAAARMIVKVAGLAFLVLLCWSCRTPTQPRESWRLAAEYSIVILGMLLFSERTWKHHCVTLVLPFAVLCYYVSAVRAPAIWRACVAASLGVAVLLMASTSTSLWEVFGYRLGAKLAQTYGAYVWAELVLLTALVWIGPRMTRIRQLPDDHYSRQSIPSASSVAYSAAKARSNSAQTA